MKKSGVHRKKRKVVVGRRMGDRILEGGEVTRNWEVTWRETV